MAYYKKDVKGLQKRDILLAYSLPATGIVRQTKDTLPGTAVDAQNRTSWVVKELCFFAVEPTLGTLPGVRLPRCCRRATINQYVEEHGNNVAYARATNRYGTETFYPGLAACHGMLRTAPHTCFLIKSETSSASSGTAFLLGLKSSSESSSSLPPPAAKLRRCCTCFCCCCVSTDPALQLAGSTSRRSSCGGAGTEASQRRPGLAAATPRAERAIARSSPWRAEDEDNAIFTVCLYFRFSSESRTGLAEYPAASRELAGRTAGGLTNISWLRIWGGGVQEASIDDAPDAIRFVYSCALSASLRAGGRIPCLGNSTHRHQSRS